MTTATTKSSVTGANAAWVRPEVRRIAAGTAEAGERAGVDGPGPLTS